SRSCAGCCVDRREVGLRSICRVSSSGRAGSSPRAGLSSPSLGIRSRELGIDLAVASTDVLPPPCPQHMFTSILSESLSRTIIAGQLRKGRGQFSRSLWSHAYSYRMRNEFPQGREVGDDDRSGQPHGLNGLDRGDQSAYRLVLPRDNDSVERQLILNRLGLGDTPGENRLVAEHGRAFPQFGQSDAVPGDE